MSATRKIPDHARSSSIARFAIDRPVTMGMCLLGVLVLGWVSVSRLPLEFLPTFSSSSITVQAPYRSSSPDEVRRLVVQPLEDSLGSINGIETMSSSAAPDSGRVSLTFVDGTDMDLASVEVRDRIDRVRHLLPTDVEQVTIRRFQSTDIPVLRFHISGGMSQEAMYHFAQEVLQRRLERIPGVAEVEVGGLRTPLVQVNVIPSRMRAHRVDVRDIVTTLRTNNQNISGGDIKEGSRKLLVRSVGEFQELAEIRRLPLNGEGLRLEDVADVVYDFPEQDSFNFLNGVESLTVRITKNSTSNLLEVVDRCMAELEEVRLLPEARDLNIRVFHDASTDVRKGLGQLRDAGLFGAGLAILAVYFFLRRFRTTLLIAVAIPVSVVGTFVMMYILRQTGISDITLNVVSLAGLMLALGMLVDNSIVVIESIFRHRTELGEDSRTAALAGTGEVALPIVASTVTTLCVFIPTIFFGGGGRMQIYMESIATTVSIVIAVSLIVALTVVPMVAVFALRGQVARTSRDIEALKRLYRRVLELTLRHRLIFVVVIVALLYGANHLFGTIDRSFGTGGQERQITLNVDTPGQFPADRLDQVYRQVYELLDTHREALDIADVSYSYDRGSGRSRRARRFEIYLVEEEKSKLSTTEARDKLRDLLPVLAGVNLTIAQGRGHGGQAGVEVEISGDDPVVLELLSQRLAAGLYQIDSIRDVDTSLESGDQEIHVQVQRERALQTGLTTQAVANTVSNSLSSRAVSQFHTDDSEVDLVVQYREEDRENLDQLKNVPVFSSGGEIALGALADFEFVAGPRTIERENRRSKISITANATSAQGTFMALRTITAMMNDFSMPPGYEWSFGRWSRIQQQDQETGFFALAFAVVLVYMLMAALFESFAQPFTIMFSVPFALLGVAVAMKLASQPLDTITQIGLIILLGVVVNNAIVLIDHINHLRQLGLSRHEAILQGGQHRLRPILITTVTTLVGLAPLVAPILAPQWFGPLEGRSATWAPIGLVIMGGLTTSTFLTLIIIPTIYSLVDDLSIFMRRVTLGVRS